MTEAVSAASPENTKFCSQYELAPVRAFKLRQLLSNDDLL
jgi:hypothetical protein